MTRRQNKSRRKSDSKSGKIKVLTFFILPLIILGLFYLTNNRTEFATMHLQYYKDGQPVSTPFQLINEGDQEIDSVRVTLDWKITGENINWDTLQIQATVVVYMKDNPNTQLDKKEYTSSLKDSSISPSFDLKTMFSNGNYASGQYTLTFKGTLHITVQDLAGHTITKDWSGSHDVTVTWNDGTGTITLDVTFG